MISPYAKQGYIDDTALSFDSYLKMIEDRFLGGDGWTLPPMVRPDTRPTVRESLAATSGTRSTSPRRRAPR